MDPASDLLSSGKFPSSNQRLDFYFIESIVDFDNSGIVYRAIDNNSGTSVFLKVLSDSLASNSSFLDAYRIQLQRVAITDHPGVAELQDIGEANGLQYFAYESTTSGLLSQQIAKPGKASVSEAIEMTIQCAEALQAALELTIFHGNLRPNNVLIFPGKNVKISELGIAAAVRAAFGHSDFVAHLGAARFLAPEMMKAGPVDFRADIYSLGLIFYFLLFNDIPFRHEGERLSGPSGKTEIKNVEEVLRVLSKMTEPNPDKRYQDYDSLIEDLRFLFVLFDPIVKVPTLKHSSEGVFKRQRFFNLLCELYASGLNGALRVIDGDVQRSFYVRDRHIIYFESNQSDESIWRWLVKKRQIELKNVPARRSSLHQTLNDALAKKAIRLEDFLPSYHELVNQTLSEMLNQPFAESEFMSAEVEGERLCNVRLIGLMFKAARYTLDLDEILNEIKPNSILDRTPQFESLIAGLSLSEIESMLVSISQQGIFTGNLNVKPGSSAEKGARFIYLLKEMGALEVRRSVAPTKQQEPGLNTLSDVTQTPPAGFQMDERPANRPRGEEWVRLELEKTAKQSQATRLDREAELRFEQAKEYFNRDKFWEAANLCEQAVNLHEDSRYYWLMGLSYAKHPRFRQKAEDSFHRGIVLNQLNDELHTDLADFYVSQGLFLRARSHALMALQIVPDQARAHQILEGPGFKGLGFGGCCCEHNPACNHIEHRSWFRKKKF